MDLSKYYKEIDFELLKEARKDDRLRRQESTKIAFQAYWIEDVEKRLKFLDRNRNASNESPDTKLNPFNDKALEMSKQGLLYGLLIESQKRELQLKIYLKEIIQEMESLITHQEKGFFLLEKQFEWKEDLFDTELENEAFKIEYNNYIALVLNKVSIVIFKQKDKPKTLQTIKSDSNPTFQTIKSDSNPLTKEEIKLIHESMKSIFSGTLQRWENLFSSHIQMAQKPIIIKDGQAIGLLRYFIIELQKKDRIKKRFKVIEDKKLFYKNGIITAKQLQKANRLPNNCIEIDNLIEKL